MVDNYYFKVHEPSPNYFRNRVGLNDPPLYQTYIAVEGWSFKTMVTSVEIAIAEGDPSKIIKTKNSIKYFTFFVSFCMI